MAAFFFDKSRERFAARVQRGETKFPARVLDAREELGLGAGAAAARRRVADRHPGRDVNQNRAKLCPSPGIEGLISTSRAAVK